MPTLTQQQIDGVAFIHAGFKKYAGVLLADTVGTGKSAQAIQAAKDKLADTGQPVLIVVPAYLTLNWIEELKFWGVSMADLCVIDQPKQQLPPSKFYLTSYNRAVSKPIFEQLFKMSFSLVVCDEAHALKAWNTSRARYILGTYKNKKVHLRARAENMLLLTGTPMKNRVEELYNIIIRIAGASIGCMKREDFIYRYAAKVWNTPYGLKHEGVKNETELQEKLKDVMIRRSFIAGIGELIHKPILLSIKDAAVKKAIQEENAFLCRLGITAESTEKDLKLNNIEAAKISEVRQRLAFAKIPVLLEVLADALDNEEQVIIFCIHRAVQSALIEKYRMVHKGGHGIINGSTTMTTRQGIIDDFQAGKTRVIFATIGALSEGVNLTACTRILYCESPWCSTDIDQANARAHRKGQSKTVVAEYFNFDGGIDRHIYRMVAKKREAICKVMS